MFDALPIGEIGSDEARVIVDDYLHGLGNPIITLQDCEVVLQLDRKKKLVTLRACNKASINRVGAVTCKLLYATVNMMYSFDDEGNFDLGSCAFKGTCTCAISMSGLSVIAEEFRHALNIMLGGYPSAGELNGLFEWEK